MQMGMRTIPSEIFPTSGEILKSHQGVQSMTSLHELPWCQGIQAVNGKCLLAKLNTEGSNLGSVGVFLRRKPPTAIAQTAGPLTKPENVCKLRFPNLE